MKMFTRLGPLNLKINIKKPIASLVVCCLLFGSLTLGSLTLSSCSPKNNPVNRDPDRSLESVAKKKAVEEKDNESKIRVNGVNNPDPKDSRILFNTPYGGFMEIF